MYLSNCSADLNKYNPLSSNTWLANGENFSIAYDDGSSAAGIFSVDIVTVSYVKIVQRNIR